MNIESESSRSTLTIIASVIAACPALYGTLTVTPPFSN